jgi:hypothetical protein
MKSKNYIQYISKSKGESENLYTSNYTVSAVEFIENRMSCVTSPKESGSKYVSLLRYHRSVMYISYITSNK